MNDEPPSGTRTVLITGGSRGIGLAAGQALAQAGMRVAITGRAVEPLKAAQAVMGRDARSYVGDVASLSDLTRIFAEVREEIGQLDALVVNAGVSEARMLEEITEAHFERLVGVNLKAVIFTVQRAAPLLRRGASVVLIGSAGGATGLAGSSVYSATKAALRGLSRSLAIELASREIRVNLLSPGITETSLVERLKAQGGMERFAAYIAEKTLMQRMGDPSEIASAIAFLCSPASSFMTGAEIAVDGGFKIG